MILLAHWCSHCQAEVTRVQSWLDEQPPPGGVTLRAISTLVDDADSSAAAAYGLRGTPLWVFIDGDGQVVQRYAGELEIEDLEPILESLAS